MPPTKPERNQESIGARLASFLSNQQEKILSEWIAAVHGDTKVQSSESLTHHQLRDHVPRLLDDLNETLRAAFDQEVKERAAYTAAIHGQHRWQEGYDLFELLRELAILRSVLIPQLIGFLEHHQDIGGAATLFAVSTLHRFLDDSMRVSVEQFLASQERGAPKA